MYVISLLSVMLGSLAKTKGIPICEFRDLILHPYNHTASTVHLVYLQWGGIFHTAVATIHYLHGVQAQQNTYRVIQTEV